MSRREVIIVDGEPTRVALVRMVVEASGSHCVALQGWPAAAEALARSGNAALAVLARGALDDAELDQVGATLGALGVPSLLLCTLEEELELDGPELLAFDASLVWPCRADALIAALDALAPGIACDPLRARTGAPADRPAPTAPAAPEPTARTAYRAPDTRAGVVEPPPYPHAQRTREADPVHASGALRGPGADGEGGGGDDDDDGAPVCWLVDIGEARLSQLRTLLEAAGAEVIELGDWSEVSLLLEVTRPPSLVVLAYEVVVAGGRDVLWAANAQLTALGAASIVLHGEGAREDVRRLQALAAFSRYLTWPAESGRIAQVVRELVPALATSAAELPAPGAPAGAPSWLDLEDLGSAVPSASRVLVAIPSLSSGGLAELPLPRLLHFLSLQRRTGVLTLRNAAEVATVSLRDGELVGLSEAQRARLDAALLWEEGAFSFEWAPAATGRSTPVFGYLHDALLRVAELETVMPLLVANEARSPVRTTVLEARRAELGAMPRALELAALCTGRRTLGELMRRGDVSLDDLARVLAFCLFTDLVTLLEAPTDAPVGLSYRLAERLADVGLAQESQFQPRSALAARGGATPSFERPGTMHQIAALRQPERLTLESLEGALQLAIDDPYTLFGVRHGAGSAAVEEGYARVRAQYPTESLPESLPAPLRVTASLLETALRDAYHVLLLEEASAASGLAARPRSGAARRPTQTGVDSTRLEPGELALLVELELRLTELTTRDPYEVFDLWPGCGQREVERAFESLKARHRPGRYTAYSAEAVRKSAAFVYSAMVGAYERLLAAETTRQARRARPIDRPRTRGPVPQQDALEHAVFAGRTAAVGDDEGRVEPLAVGRPRTGSDGAVRVRVPVLAASVARRQAALEDESRAAPSRVDEPAAVPSPQALFAEGQRALSRQDFAAAREALGAAARGEPQSGLFAAWAAWAEYLALPTSAAPGGPTEKALKRAARQEGGLEMACFFLGTLAMKDGRLDEAERYFKRALRENAGNVEVERALRLARMRREAEAGRGTLLGRLFNKP